MATEHLTRAELGRALGLEAGDVPLPVSARSLTRSEIRARDWREIRWIVPAYLLLIVAAVATVALGRHDPGAGALAADPVRRSVRSRSASSPGSGCAAAGATRIR